MKVYADLRMAEECAPLTLTPRVSLWVAQPVLVAYAKNFLALCLCSFRKRVLV